MTLFIITSPELIALINDYSRSGESHEKFLIRSIKESRRLQDAVDDMARLSDKLCPR